MTAEQENYIKIHWDEMSSESLRKQFNEVFGVSYKYTTFLYHTKQLGLSKHNSHRYTAEEDDFLRDNSNRMTRKELTDLFNKTYGTQIKECAITQRCHLKGWDGQTNGQFKKGSVPWEKTEGGREEYVKKLKGGNIGSFKKGHIPNGTLELGTVRLWGHELKIKTDDGWKNIRRYLWEKEHGAIPDGCVIISTDGNISEKDINKLRLVSNRTHTTLISNNWFGKGSEIVDTGIAWCNLKNALERSEE